MTSKGSYGQYCPLAMSTELLCNRWMMLVVRELLDGSTGFNEIKRGLPLISRTLLSNRLKELELAGVVRKASARGGKRMEYRLTEAGNALGAVVSSMAMWGQEWIDTEVSLNDIDTDFLMWDVRRNVKPSAELPPKFVVQFTFPDAPEKKQCHWLVFDAEEVDLCYRDPGLEVTVYIEADLAIFTKVWMGWEDIVKMQDAGHLIIDGPPEIVRRTKDWLGLSGLASTKKQPENLRVMRQATR